MLILNKGLLFKRVLVVGDVELGDELLVVGRILVFVVKFVGVKCFFSVSKVFIFKSILMLKKRWGCFLKNVKFGLRLDDDDVFFEDVWKFGRLSKVFKVVGDEDEGEGDIVCGICVRGYFKVLN